jgi:hypothetical protein
MNELCLAAMPFVSQAKLEETARHWLADGRIAHGEARGAAAVGATLALVLDIALFTQGSRMSVAADELEHVVVVPGGLLAPAA